MGRKAREKRRAKQLEAILHDSATQEDEDRELDRVERAFEATFGKKGDDEG